MYIPAALAAIALLWVQFRLVFYPKANYGDMGSSAKRKIMRGESFRIIVAIFSSLMVYTSQILLYGSLFISQFFGALLFIIGYQLLLWTAGVRLEILGTGGRTSTI